MLQRIKTYLGIMDNESDALLNIIIEDAQSWFNDYTHRAAADYPNIICKMAIEDYNRYGSEGIASLSFGAGIEVVNAEYSEGLMKQIKKLKKVRVL
jgi:hypothetical protein